MIATLTTSKNPQKNPGLHHIITPRKGCSLDYDKSLMGQGFGNALGELIGAGQIPTKWHWDAVGNYKAIWVK